MTIVFMDTECTGLSPEDHIWEWAAIRRDETGHVERYHCFVQHDVTKAERLPESFRLDHAVRYNPDEALTLDQFVSQVRMACAGRPHIVGAVPNFDTERIARILALYDLTPPWHYHLRDVENVAIGYLQGRASLGDEAARAALDNVDDSNALSRACGVEPPGDGVRHTAMGDVEWSMTLWDAVTSRLATAGQAAPMPVFTIKAKDRLADDVIRSYRRLCLEYGLTGQAAQVALALEEIRIWRAAHAEYVVWPDHRHVPAVSA